MSFQWADHDSKRRQRLQRAALIVSLVMSSATAFAADGPLLLRESFSFNRDETAIRRLDDVREYIRTKRWDQAADLLIQLAEERGKSLVPMHPGWYVSVSRRCHLLTASLPPEGRTAYRRKIDDRAAKWLAEGISGRNEEMLQRIVREAFCSSSGDDALLTLGQWAWDAGHITIAREYWSRILPAKTTSDDVALHYPDTNHNHADIHARLILCDVMLGQADRAQSALDRFQQTFATANGKLAGRNGKYVETLTAVLSEAKSWKRDDGVRSWPTLAGGVSRQMVLSHELEIASPRWKRLLVERKSIRSEIEQFPRNHHPNTFPVIDNGRAYFADAGRVFGYELRDGSPAFSAKNENGTSSILQRATLYSNGDVSPFLLPSDPVVGQPTYTTTVSGGRLFARLGSPITGHSKTETRAERSSLVCLDLERGEGKLAWKVEARSLGIGWEFEGAPAVDGEKLYVVLRRRNPETEIHVACYDAERGRRLWITPIGSAIASVDEGVNQVSHLMLTLAAGRLFLSTDSGALASLDARAGLVDWIVTYRSGNVDRKSPREFADAQSTPCLYEDGMLFAAPSDSDRLFAVDARTGQPRWQKKLRGGVQHLLGVSHGNLIVSGQRLWGLDRQTGKPRWNLGYEDPAGHGFGRGLLAGDAAYWPLRHEILKVDVATGRLKRRIRLQAAFGRSGGNLAYAAGMLLIAEPNRMAAYPAEFTSPRQD